MQTRSRSITPHQRPNQQPSTASRQVLSPTPSRTQFATPSATPSSSRKKSYQRKIHPSTTELMAESSQAPASPTPQKGHRTRRTPVKRVKSKRNDNEASDGPVESADQEEAEGHGGDEDMLFDLLGVTSPPVETPNRLLPVKPVTSATRGILNVSKSDLEQAKPRRSNRKQNKVESSPETEERRREQSNEPREAGNRSGLTERDAQSEAETKRRSQRKKGRVKVDQLDSPPTAVPRTQPISALSASRPSKSHQPLQPIDYTPVKAINEYNYSDAFETESLSRSLPTGKLFASPASQQVPQTAKGKVKGKKGQSDEGSVWEMPSSERPSTTQALTWQQQLQSSSSSQDSPRRSNKSTPKSGSSTNSDRKPRSRPASSTVHLNQFSNGMVSSPLVPRPSHPRRLSLDNVPISTFDHNQPFHTGMNVNRPPQTPAKLPGNMAPGAALPLLQGEFPRIGKISNAGTPPAPMGAATPAGIKYAGPTFHNSPHAASLPKPDLDDF